MPEICSNGVMICGDAAMFVNNLHWEGTNLAMISGKLAGETAIIALGKGDFSAKTLSLYRKKLEKSFILKDLKTYRNLMQVMSGRAEHFLGYYPKKINSFFEMFTSVDGIPKRKKYRDFIKSLFTDRNFIEIIKDFCAFIRLLWSILVL